MAYNVRTAGAATAALVAVTAVWGSTFVVVKDAIARMPVADFLTWRFGLATAVMLALRPRAVAALGSLGRRRGVLLGLALAAGYQLQTYGLRSTPAGVSGFITGMFVVFTPLIGGAVLRRPVGRAAWVAVVLATGGLALLSLRGASVGVGELLTLGCAFAYGVHIVGLGEWSAGHDAYGLAVVQLATVTAVSAGVGVVGSGVAPAASAGFVVPPDGGVWGALALTAVLATAVGFLVQTWAQARLAPTRAAVIMTLEPVFAGAFGVVYGETLAARAWIGAALVLAAMLLVELGSRPQEVARLEV